MSKSIVSMIKGREHARQLSRMRIWHGSIIWPLTFEWVKMLEGVVNKVSLRAIQALCVCHGYVAVIVGGVPGGDTIGMLLGDLYHWIQSESPGVSSWLANWRLPHARLTAFVFPLPVCRLEGRGINSTVVRPIYFSHWCLSVSGIPLYILILLHVMCGNLVTAVAVSLHWSLASHLNSLLSLPPGPHHGPPVSGVSGWCIERRWAIPLQLLHTPARHRLWRLLVGGVWRGPWCSILLRKLAITVIVMLHQTPPPPPPCTHTHSGWLWWCGVGILTPDVKHHQVEWVMKESQTDINIYDNSH